MPIMSIPEKVCEKYSSINDRNEKAKRWVTSKSLSLSEEEWKELMEEDSQHPYSEFPTTNPTGQNVEEEIVTDNYELQDDSNANNDYGLLQGSSYDLQGGNCEDYSGYGGYEEHVYSGTD